MPNYVKPILTPKNSELVQNYVLDILQTAFDQDQITVKDAASNDNKYNFLYLLLNDHIGQKFSGEMQEIFDTQGAGAKSLKDSLVKILKNLKEVNIVNGVEGVKIPAQIIGKIEDDISFTSLQTKEPPAVEKKEALTQAPQYQAAVPSAPPAPAEAKEKPTQERGVVG